MNITTEPPPPQAIEFPADLILSLDHATLMAKQFPATSDSNHLLQIYSSLHQAHHHLSSFISQNQIPLFPLPTPPPSRADAAENSLSSATGATAATTNENGNEPMQIGDDDDCEAGAEENSMATIDKVEERLRYCFIKNKRLKRTLSPSSVVMAAAAAAATEERKLGNDGFVEGIKGYDPYGAKQRAFELIYQFHA